MGRACSTHEEKRNTHRILTGKPEEKDHWKDLDVGGKIILEWIIETQDRVVWT
jgi:hypothetical protein